MTVARLVPLLDLKLFSIQDIAATLDMLNAETQSEGFTMIFVDYMNGRKAKWRPSFASACQTLKLYPANP